VQIDPLVTNAQQLQAGAEYLTCETVFVIGAMEGLNKAQFVNAACS
jgi:hypothetical protein